MQLKNKIINYFVSKDSSGIPRCFLSPVTMSAETGKSLINKQLKKENTPPLPQGPILHVCYDYDSQIIYIVNASEFAEENMKNLLSAAEVRITQDFGSFSNKPPIKGSPFSSLRVRSLNSFSHARDIISKHFKGKVFKDIPVIEAFLPRMPLTLKTLPEEYKKHEELLGGYIGTSFAPSISFVEEFDIRGKKLKNPQLLLTQPTPFVLINISKGKKHEEITATEKEWVVLTAYRDYLNDTQTVEKEEKYIDKSDINKFADLYAIKRLLYLGWSFEEVTSYMMQDKIHSFGELLNSIDLFMRSSDSLVQEGYKNVAEVPYYITFKIDESFPLSVASITNKTTGQIDLQGQYKNFMVLDYDEDTKYVLIETPVFITPPICIKVLKAKSTPFIARYNSIANKIDIKGEERGYKELQKDKVQLAKIKGIVKSGVAPDKRQDLDFRSGRLASGGSFVDPNICTVRKVSDYLYASDFIKKMCVEAGIKFFDFDVVIGPTQRMGFGNILGGFMDEKMFEANKWKVPKEIEKGIWISPPVMVINSVKTPSYAEQTETLIHEYRHYIYHIEHPDYKMGYDSTKKKKKGEDYEYWWNYLSDPNERAAFMSNIKFELGLGKSYDEVVRNLVGGQVDTRNYPIALKYAELVEEARKELEEEGVKNEEPIG